ncbi:hypothetical protein GCM10011375_18770 [Hymenobacter qilianensis]|uniref:Uncharacterized protein n=2 Tax=Hymenobacter qilianensis TaxID=1385715 RepID=A0ACB5PR70_9BACT|nr:T9SS type A sorting domain-containing protein [Hymenobacter qilianensis]QNP52052.1 T9SS type A sorting domain-containing protein [Hymenobacter qilianensis]GGF64124.1 hypothetical protein GCM10011375_18770 [Hymenobacter qilianensis]
MGSKIILLQLLICFLSHSLSANTYYVSPYGDDNASGTSVSTAWHSLNRVNAGKYQPGDRILLAGGETFKGNIWLRGNSQGTAEKPIIISSYGHGNATIESGAAFGFYGYNMAGIELRRLNFVGSGRLTNKDSGIQFYLDSANTTLNHVRLDSIDVSGYQSTGIIIGSWNGNSGYNNVRITNSKAHANGEAGISSYAENIGAHTNWYVGNCKAFDNSGREDITHHNTGNGIVLSGISGALIEHCEAYNNGWLNSYPNGGPVGIWGWNCNNLVIQECESHHNRSGMNHDGGGFDLDGGCTNSVLQYNYSHDNDGAGYLIAQYPGAPPLTDVTIRYNISVNDARRYNQGAIQLWSSGDNGGIQRASIHNNTVYLAPPANGSHPKAVYVMSGGVSDITFQNNVLHTTDGIPVISIEGAATNDVRFQGNCYWSADAELSLWWGGTRYTTLSAWRAGAGQEQIGAKATGINADPEFMTSGVEPVVAQRAFTTSKYTEVGYTLLPSSSLLGAGLNLLTEFGKEPGLRDYFGNPTAKAGTQGNIGASENRNLILSSRSGTMNSLQSWCTAYPTQATETVYITFASDVIRNKPVSVKLYDMQGRLARNQNFTRPDTKDAAFSVHGLAAGHYLLRVESGNLSSSQSVIVTQ